MAEWINLDAENAEELDNYRKNAIEASELLYDMSSAQMSELVPYIKITLIDEAGKPKAPPLTNELYEAPKFGDTLSQRFGDRPPASLESITVTWSEPMGVKMFRMVDIGITVHRPDAVFGLGPDPESEDRGDKYTAIRSILDLSNEFLLEYGWSGPLTNPLVGGVRTEGENKARIRDVLRMKVTYYDFNITQDGQVKLSIKAIENGELLTRHITIFTDLDADKGAKKGDPNSIQKSAQSITEKLKSFIKDNSQTMEYQVKQKKENDQVTLATERCEFLTFKQVFDVLFAVQLEKLTTKLGFKTLTLQFGLFNSKCPDSAYGQEDCADDSIGNYQIPATKVFDILNNQAVVGSSVSLHRTMEMLVGLLNSSTATWGGDLKSDEVVIPEVTIRSVYDQQQSVVLFQVVDRRRYVEMIKGEGADDINHTNVREKVKEIRKGKLREFLKNNSMPLVDLFSENNIVKSSRFGVVTDDSMANYFIDKQMQPSKGVRTQGYTPSAINGPTISPIHLLYNSAIKGEITMFGNFSFDVTGMVWMKFNIWAYDGPYYVVSRVDKIDRNGFFTTLNLMASGDDPLGVKKLIGAPDKQATTIKGALQNGGEAVSEPVSDERQAEGGI